MSSVLGGQRPEQLRGIRLSGPCGRSDNHFSGSLQPRLPWSCGPPACGRSTALSCRFAPAAPTLSAPRARKTPARSPRAVVLRTRRHAFVRMRPRIAKSAAPRCSGDVEPSADWFIVQPLIEMSVGRLTVSVQVVVVQRQSRSGVDMFIKQETEAGVAVRLLATTGDAHRFQPPKWFGSYC